MTTKQEPSNALNILLWIAHVVLAGGLAWGSAMKLIMPVEKLSAMWPWAGQVPMTLLKFTGIVDLLGALGLILPSLLRIKPLLTPIAALGVIILMITASIFHIVRGESSNIGPNIFFAIIAAFIAWGRFVKAPIPSK